MINMQNKTNQNIINRHISMDRLNSAKNNKNFIL